MYNMIICTCSTKTHAKTTLATISYCNALQRGTRTRTCRFYVCLWEDKCPNICGIIIRVGDNACRERCALYSVLYEYRMMPKPHGVRDSKNTFVCGMCRMRMRKQRGSNSFGYSNSNKRYAFVCAVWRRCQNRMAAMILHVRTAKCFCTAVVCCMRMRKQRGVNCCGYISEVPCFVGGVRKMMPWELLFARQESCCVLVCDVWGCEITARYW